MVMTWPLHMVSRISHAMITYVDGERMKTKINPPSYRFFGVDAKGNGVYRRYNDPRSRRRDGMFVSFTHDRLGRFEAMELSRVVGTKDNFTHDGLRRFEVIQ